MGTENIKFDDNLMVQIESLTKEQAEVFILFLEVEKVRHGWDIEHTDKRIEETRRMFNL